MPFTSLAASTSRPARRVLRGLPATQLSRRTFLTRAAAASAASAMLARSLPGVRPAFGQAVEPPRFVYGMQAHMYHRPWEDVAGALALVQDAGFGWVKQQVRWADVEPVAGEPEWASLDSVVDLAAQANVRVLLSVVSAPAWSRADGITSGPPDDPALLGDFVFRLASRYAGRVHAYEIWNEQNFSREWGGAPIDAGAYVELLKAAYPAVKAADPAALVISGGLTPTGTSDPVIALEDTVYLRQMYEYQGGIFRTVCDAVGAHIGGFNNPPDDTPERRTVASTTFKGHMSFYFRRIEQLREVMVLGGDAAKQVWVTEMGWSTANAAQGYEYGSDNTEFDQARYLVRAFDLARAYGWVGGMFVWNLNFQQVVPDTDEKWAFSILRADGSPRPAFLMLKAMPKL